MAMPKTSSEKHIAVLTFPFGGHAGGVFNLVYKLAISSPSILFSFFSTEKCNRSLFSPANSLNIPSNINAYIISDGVPSGHVLSGNPLEGVELFLKSAPDDCRKSLVIVEAATRKKFTSLIADAFLTFAVDIAQELQISWIAVWTSMSSCLSAHIYTDVIRNFYGNSPGDQTLEAIPGLSMVQVKDLPEEVLSHENQDSIFVTFLSKMKVLTKATAVAINCFEELNLQGVEMDLHSKIKNLLHVGFLSVPQLPPPPRQPSNLDETGCLSWLDKQAPASVAYVGFGSVATPPPHELVALAEALEESGFPFLWSLKDDQKAILPTGFLERTSNKCGKIVPWTPQMQVLGHSSTSVFITHCGWNSVCESIVCGVPMIYRPFFGDHRMVGRMVELWEIGMMVEGGEFTKSGLIRSLDFALGGDNGQKMRAKAHQIKSVVLEAAGPNGNAAKNLNTLLKLIS